MRAVCPVAITFLLLLPGATTGAAQAPVPPAAQEPERSDPDVRLDPLQPDFNLAALPTTLRMPKGKWAFRVTHRFTRDLGQGDFGDQLSNLFGLDGGAQIGLEVRIGIRSGTQVGIHRTSDRAIQLFAQHNLFSERRDHSFGLDVLAALEGADNLSDDQLGAFGLALSKNAGERLALYAEPIFVYNANPLSTGDRHTTMLGLGGRLRVGRSASLMAEYTPRLAGYQPSNDQITFGFESRAGGHLFQLNVGNGWGTTLGQLARGGIEVIATPGAAPRDQWFLGFAISRKFF